MTSRRIHPTKEKLIETMVSLMDSRALHEIQVEDVLHESKISKGSLYHHFENFDDLTAAALIFRFADSVDRSIEMVGDVINKATNADEFIDGVILVTTATQGPERSRFRLERARVIGLSINSPRIADDLALEQERLTQAMTDVVREGQEKGWVSKQFSAQTIAVFLQAYTLGRVVDDVATEEVRIDSEDWNNVVNAAVKALLTF